MVLGLSACVMGVVAFGSVVARMPMAFVTIRVMVQLVARSFSLNEM